MVSPRCAAFAAILVAVVCFVGVLGATEKPAEEKKVEVQKVAEKSDKSTTSIPSKTVTRQGRKGPIATRAVDKDDSGKKPARSTKESSASGPTPAATNGPPAAYAPSAIPTTGFTSTADSPYAHLFHPSAIDLSSFFAPQFQNPGKQEQLDLSSFYAQYNTAPANFGNTAPLAPISGYTFPGQSGKQQQSVYNSQFPGAQVFVSQPGHRAPNSDIVYQSQKPGSAQDYNLVYQTIKQSQKGNPVVFPTQKTPAVVNDYSTVHQAQRPNVANIRKPTRKPVKLSATYQSQRPPSAADYASVYQKTPTAPSAAPVPSHAPQPELQYVQNPQQQVVYVPQTSYAPQSPQTAYAPQSHQTAYAPQSPQTAYTPQSAYQPQTVFAPQSAYAAQPPQQGQVGPVKVDVNAIVSSQVLPQIQQQGGQGIQLLDLSAFYPQQQNKGQPLYQVTGGKTLSAVRLNPSLYQHLQQQQPQAHDDKQHAEQPNPAVPTLSPEQLAAFYQSIGAQPPPPPSPSPSAPTAGQASAAHPTAHAAVAAPTPAVYQAAYNPAASAGNSHGVQYQYQLPAQQASAAPVDLTTYYKALQAAQAQSQGAAGQSQGQTYHQATSQAVLPPELAAIYRQQQVRYAAAQSSGASHSGTNAHSGGNVVYLQAGQDPREVQYTYAPQPGAAQANPAQVSYSPGQTVFYSPQYQLQGQKQLGGGSRAPPPSSIASLISQLTSAGIPTASPAYYAVKPTVAASYLATTAAAAPSRRPRPQLKYVTSAPFPSLDPTPNPTQPAMPSKTRQLVKKPHSFGPGYSFEITGRR